MDIDQLKKEGKRVALAIMILAMFFYALEVNEHGPIIKWGEVGAILIIFLLAELGVTLVIKSSEIKEGVADAADTAKNVIQMASQINIEAEKITGNVAIVTEKSKEVFDKATGILTEAEGKANDAWKKLDQAAISLTDLADSDLWRKIGLRFCDAVGMKPKEFWKHLERFTLSWTPNGETPPGPDGHQLVRILFDTFIGNDKTGTVQSKGDWISCVTLDSVFAEASAQWLSVMAAEDVNPPQRLVVWAVTSLLPTEFATTSIWWSDSKPGEPPKRTETLEKFIGSVIRACAASGQAVEEYRRITVFDPERYIDSDFEAGDWKDHYKDSLANWLIWDPRINKSHIVESDFDKVMSHSGKIAENIWMQKGRSITEIEIGRRPVSWQYLKDLYNNVTNVEGYRKNRILPSLPCSKNKHFYLFHNYFGEEVKSSLGGLIGASTKFLDETVTIKDLRDLSLDHLLFMTCEEEAGGQTLNLREVYRKLGWCSLQEWYCTYLHRGTDIEPEGAWWAELKKGEDKFLDPLTLDCDGYKVRTLDLLLIGTKIEPSGEGICTEKEKFKWYGAAISNIKFDRTECTVQLVTRETRLEEIAGAVEHLCKNFAMKEPLPQGVKDYGKWIKWPQGSDKAPQDGA